jgi:SAM-dependent methyltransferase
MRPTGSFPPQSSIAAESTAPIEAASLQPESCYICSQSLEQKWFISNVQRPNLKAILFVCRGCGTGQTWYPEGHGETYGAAYYSYSAISYSKWKQRAKTLVWKMPGAQRWVTMIPPQQAGRVLDIGCGCGVTLDLLQSVGWETYGTEISAEAIDICRKNRHRVLPAGQAEFPDHFFDWITLDNVLEHIIDPRKLLVSVRRWLNQSGLLTICVPNFGGVDAEFWGRYWQALEPPHHEFHFTARGLQMLLDECGFRARPTFQPRFVSANSMRNAHHYASHSWALIQMEKMGHLLTARKIQERFGFFITVNATASR